MSNVTTARRNAIRTYWITKGAQWKAGGLNKAAGHVDEFVRAVNKPGGITYAELEQAVRVLYAELYTDRD